MAQSQTQGEGPWSDAGYRNGSDIESDNAAWDRHIAASSSSRGLSEGDYWNSRGPTQADRYAENFAGEVFLARGAGGRLELSSEPALAGSEDLSGLSTAELMSRAKSLLAASTSARSTDRALDNMSSLAEAYRVSGMTGATGDPLTFESSVLAGAGLKAPSDGFWFGFTGGSRSALDAGGGSMSFAENAGLFARGLITSPYTAAYGLASEIGSQYRDLYNSLGGSSSNYHLSSGLFNSYQREGIGGTLIDVGAGLLSAPTQPVVDLIEGRYQQAGAGLPGTFAAGFGLARLGGTGLGVVALNGATRTVPLGFASEQQFAAAANDLRAALKASGVDDALVGVRGSSITGFGSNPKSSSYGQPFGPHSDVDFFVQSSSIADGFKRQPDFVHPKALLPAYPELRDWSQQWSRVLGREVTPAVWRPGALPQTPAILVVEP